MRNSWVCVGLCVSLLMSTFGCGSSEPSRSNHASTGGAQNIGGAGTGGAKAVAGATSVGTEPPAHASVVGTLKGKAFVASGGATRRFYWSGNSLVSGGAVQGAILSGISIALGDYANLCTAVRDTARPILEFYLRATTAELAPGTFPLVMSTVEGVTDAPPEGTLNYFSLYADACSVSNQDWATSGSVTLTRVTSTRVEGSFSATLETSGTVSGEFALDECARAKSFPDDTDTTMACGVF